MTIVWLSLLRWIANLLEVIREELIRETDDT